MNQPITDRSFKAEIFGCPLTKSQIDIARKIQNSFLRHHASKIREVVKSAERYGGIAAFDIAIMDCRSPSKSPKDRAEAAWRALAWDSFINAYNHQNRSFYQNRDILVEAVKEHPEALYRYGVYILREPNEGVYALLSEQSDNLSKLYIGYCINIIVAKIDGRHDDLANLWGV